MAVSISTSLRTGAVIGTTLSARAAASNGATGSVEVVSGLNRIAARLSPGAISENSSSHLPPSEASKLAKPVTFPDRLLPDIPKSYADELGITCMVCFPKVEFWKRMGSFGEGAIGKP